jgi:hypothetical protein
VNDPARNRATASKPLHLQLDEAQRALVDALEEACAIDLEALDTQELMKIEETLDEASKAAKEAVSVRLRLEGQEGRAGSQPQPQTQTRTSGPSIPHRIFDDRRGKQWHAFEVQSTRVAAGRAGLPQSFQLGWLVFDSADEVRRIAPTPAGWHELSIDELRTLHEQAASNPKRTRSPQRSGSPDQGLA